MPVSGLLKAPFFAQTPIKCDSMDVKAVVQQGNQRVGVFMSGSSTNVADVDRIEDDIRERMGVCPSFFFSATDSPKIMEGLWLQTQAAYLDNPLPSLFKEKLFAYLSRFCDIPYCLARHCAFLLGRGHVAGDAACEPLAHEEVLQLVQQPLPTVAELDARLSTLAAVDGPLDAWPEAGSSLETDLLICSVPVFLRRSDAGQCQAELRRVLGATAYNQLLMLMAFIRTAHFWTENHPDLGFEEDLQQLLAEQQALAQWISYYPARVNEELQQRTSDELTQLRIAHSEFEQSQRRLQAIFDHTDQFLGLLSPDGILLDANCSWCESVGVRKSEVTSQPLWEGPWWSHSPQLKQRLRRAIEQAAAGVSDRFEAMYPNRDGVNIAVDFSISPVRDEAGKIILLVPEGHDITERKRAEQTVREREQFTRRIINNMFAFVGVMDLDGTLIEANEAPLKAAGITFDDVYGKKFWDCYWWNYSPDIQRGLMDACERARAGEIVRYDVPVRMAEEKLMMVDFQLAPARDDQGKMTHLIPSGVDITDRKQAESEVRRLNEDLEQRIAERTSELQRLAKVFTDSVNAIVITDVSGCVVDMNSAAERQYGGTRNELIGQSIKGLVPPEKHAQCDELMSRCLRLEEIRSVESQQVTKDGRRLHVLLSLSRLSDESGRPIGIATFSEDISQQRAAARALRVKDHAIHSAIMGIAFGDLNGVITYVNPAFVKMFGYDNKSEIVGRSNTELTSEASVIDEIMVSVKSRGFWSGEDLAKKQDGTSFPIELAVSLIEDESNKPIGMVATFIDISQRKQAEGNLLRMSKVFTDAADAIFIKDLTGRVVDMNAAAERQYGWTRDELIGQSIKKIVPPEEHQRRDELMARCLRGEEVRSVEVTRITKSRRVLPVLLTLSLLLDDNGQATGMATISEDITERKQAEDELRNRQERLSSILNAAADAIFTVDHKGIINEVNAATIEMFGYAEEELLDQNISRLMSPPYPDEYGNSTDRHLQDFVALGNDVIGRRKDGSTFPANLAVSEVAHYDLFTTIIRDVSTLRRLERDVIGIAEDEQRRIGQDLHDSVQQELAGLSMLSQTLLDNLGEDRQKHQAGMTELRDLASKLVNGISRTQQEVRSISKELVPMLLTGQGLMDTLRELASRTDEIDGITCAFKCEEPVEIADDLTAVHLYRIAQEATANALKHGRAEHILIALVADHGQPVLQVADDGIGFDHSQPREGMGLKTMLYRARLINAAINLDPVDGGGTLVTCRIVGGDDVG